MMDKKDMKKNQLWYFVKQNYELLLMTQRDVYRDEALDYYYEYKRKGGKRRIEGLEGRSYSTRRKKF